MLKNIFRRYQREPLVYAAVLLFAAVLSVILCHMQKSQEDELKSFQETYHTVPVYFTVTDLDGSQLRGARSIEGWVVDLFIPRSYRISDLDFVRFIKELKIRMEIEAIPGEFEWLDQNDFFMKLSAAEAAPLVGISSVRVAQELTPEYNGEIHWCEGYGEEVLETEQLVCLVSDDYTGGDEVVLSVVHNDSNTGEKVLYTFTLTVVGHFKSDGTSRIYCPYLVAENICNKLHIKKEIYCISATLVDNDLLDELRETASLWFAEPTPGGALTPWGKFGYKNYPYAMDINDALLQHLMTTLKNIMTINRVSSVLIFVMSALAGFLVGFLVIRSRKREITLMRTLGCSNRRIYAEFALEQLLCILGGVLLGGGYTLWHPLWKLAAFTAINFVGLSTALIVFLNVNLLSTVKEDE